MVYLHLRHQLTLLTDLSATLNQSFNLGIIGSLFFLFNKTPSLKKKIRDNVTFTKRKLSCGKQT